MPRRRGGWLLLGASSFPASIEVFDVLAYQRPHLLERQLCLDLGAQLPVRSVDCADKIGLIPELDPKRMLPRFDPEWLSG
jgi:hypothetical protein